MIGYLFLVTLQNTKKYLKKKKKIPNEDLETIFFFFFNFFLYIRISKEKNKKKIKKIQWS